MLRLMIGILLMTCCAAGVVHAVNIYQWKDSGGITHFTDNAMNVPEKYRKVAKREVNKLRISGSSEDAQGNPKALGEAVWLGKCASCHTTGENEKDKLGLGILTVNQQTKFPATVEKIVPKLRWAASGRWSDMPSVDVTDEELKKIAKFILGDQ